MFKRIAEKISKKLRKPTKEEAQSRVEPNLAELFNLLRHVDEQRIPAHIRNRPRYIVTRLEEIQIRIDGDTNHARGHVHIQYKKEGHAASYAIDDGSRLAGKLPTYYDRVVRRWIADNKKDLDVLW